MKRHYCLVAGLILVIVLITACVQEQEIATTTTEAPDSFGSSTGAESTSFSMFLNVSGIEGESMDQSHEEWIDVVSYSHDITQPSSGGSTASGRSVARSEFSIVKAVDRSSPQLKGYVKSGEHIDEVTLDLYQAEDEKQTFLHYKLEDVIIASVKPAGSSAEGQRLEEVTFSYGAITWTSTNMTTGSGQPADTEQPWQTAETK